MHVFPRLAPVERFPALGISYMFSRACGRLHHVFALGSDWLIAFVVTGESDYFGFVYTTLR